MAQRITLKQVVKTAEKAVDANFKRRHDPSYGDLYRDNTRSAIYTLRRIRQNIALPKPPPR